MTPDQLNALSKIPQQAASNLSLPHSPTPNAAGPTNAAANIDQQLNALADIHLPDAISWWWPPAPGWWILALLSIGVAYGIFKLVKKLIRQAYYKKMATNELARVLRHWKKQQNVILTASKISTLLRRLSLLIDKRTSVASLQQQEWLDYLQQQTGLNNIQNYKDILLDLPYQDPHIHLDIQEQKQLASKINQLLNDIQLFINKNSKKALKNV